MPLSKRSRDYGQAISFHSLRSIADSLYPGQNYTNLAHILGETPAFGHLSDFLSGASLDSSSIAVLYDLETPEPHAGPGSRCRTFKSDEHCLLQDLPEPREPNGQILFLRGYLSADWIKTIGAKYRVDPEFFQRHLALPSAPIHESVFSLPSLPSSTRNIITLGIPTIACHDPGAASLNSIDLQEHRAKDTIAMYKYLRSFNMLAIPGDSMVRSYKALDKRFSLIEQNMSLCIEKSVKGWTAIVWLDNGNSLHSSPKGPWMDHTRSRAIASTIIPVQQHLKHVALKDMLRSSALNQTNQTSSAQDIPIKQSFLQSASLLPLQYSRYLDHETAAKDFIFATADIFQFAAYAEIQFLNLLQLLINDIVGQRPHTQRTLLEGEPEPTYTLLEYKTILDQHQQRLEETLATLRRREHSGWPRADKEHQRRKADNQARRLEEDYQYMVMRTRQLAAACQEGVTMLTNRVVINEAKKAMEQTERMKKLTMLATFFIPLSFTSSVFGMNFKEFGNQSVLSIWIWVVVTVPTVFMTAVIYLWDISMLRKRLAWFTKQRHHVLEKQV